MNSNNFFFPTSSQKPPEQ